MLPNEKQVEEDLEEAVESLTKSFAEERPYITATDDQIAFDNLSATALKDMRTFFDRMKRIAALIEKYRGKAA